MIEAAATVAIVTTNWHRRHRRRQQIAAVVTAGSGGEVMMTRADHPTGTDRVAEVAVRPRTSKHHRQSSRRRARDLRPALDLVVALLANDREAPMATLATPIRDASIYSDPACVKVVCNQRGRALYFSRSPIPCHRDGLPDPATAATPVAYLHLGLYAYRRDFLLELSSLPPSPLEAAEKLEQLRVLEAGHSIAIGVVDEPSVGIDTPEDYRRFVARWRKSQNQPG